MPVSTLIDQDRSSLDTSSIFTAFNIRILFRNELGDVQKWNWEHPGTSYSRLR